MLIKNECQAWAMDGSGSHHDRRVLTVAPVQVRHAGKVLELGVRHAAEVVVVAHHQDRIRRFDEGPARFVVSFATPCQNRRHRLRKGKEGGTFTSKRKRQTDQERMSPENVGELWTRSPACWSITPSMIRGPKNSLPPTLLTLLQTVMPAFRQP